MRISTEIIKNAIKKKDPNMLPVCCILHERPKNRITNEAVSNWTLVARPTTGGAFEISRAEALDLIDLLQLQPYSQGRMGTVYDTADQKYRNAYHNVVVRID